MGLFKRKQSKKQSSSAEADASSELFDTDYHRQLRETGRQFFKQALTDSAKEFKQDLDSTISQMNSDLKHYMTKRLDATISHVDQELSRRLDDRLKEYDRVTKDAHDMAVKSLNHSAQALHDQYQQFNTALEKSIASQEAMMITYYEENKAQISKTQEAQDAALQSLDQSVQSVNQQREQVTADMEKRLKGQEDMVQATMDQTRQRIAATKDSQDMALQSINQSAAELRRQYEQIGTTLDKNIAERESIMVEAFQDNMARVVEHYLLGALGDQYDIKAQLPSIIQQLEDNKQTIVDDIKL